jgi:cation transport protein ChaC
MPLPQPCCNIEQSLLPRRVIPITLSRHRPAVPAMHLASARTQSPVPLPAALHDDPPPGDFWVFAYGSLIWNPGFAFIERRTATLHGWHRRFCIRSIRYRGTPDAPGLVLGLDRGGSCRGVAMRVAAADATATLQYLDAREIPDPVYRRRLLPVRLACGARGRALTYVARRDWPGFCTLPIDQAAAMIAAAHGTRGSNRDYLLHTLHGLHEAGIADPALRQLAACLPAREAIVAGA